jgi:hypothetical protein
MLEGGGIDLVLKYGMVEKDERKSEDRPVRDIGTEMARVGCKGNDREATLSASVIILGIDRHPRTAGEACKVRSDCRSSNKEIAGCKV